MAGQETILNNCILWTQEQSTIILSLLTRQQKWTIILSLLTRQQKWTIRQTFLPNTADRAPQSKEFLLVIINILKQKCKNILKY